MKNRSSKRQGITRGAIAFLAAALMAAVIAAPASAALRHFDGKVVGKNSADRTFQAKTQSGHTRTFRVNDATDFQRIKGGFSGLDNGLKVEITAKRTDSGLLAKQVERKRNHGGGGHGGGNDDGPNHS